MRFYITALIASLATISMADTMTVFTECGPFGLCDSKNAIFYTASGTYNVDANKGCRGTGVPGMTEFCVDWDRFRGHFKFSHQAKKRCLVMRSRASQACPAYRCDKSEWEEVGCN
ncbi:hypothetical protein LX32DRAFT_603388 [Colletotrichum zoysiae]|uniref:Uncharacterized protein n=1 Tax=Colletotrichum zoysiae TaxID=1216348 RepID=A0AAD9H466_9PEZI|nr:hypothetical protein LX32DRAFT_603388 [Colletotrichum zoysiae]